MKFTFDLLIFFAFCAVKCPSEATHPDFLGYSEYLRLTFFQAGPTAKKCFKAQKETMTEWFRLSCLWHMGVDKCMEGGDVEEKFEVLLS